MKLVTTLQNIKEHNPNRAILNDLLEKMGQDIDNPDLSAEVSLRFILESLGLRNALSSIIVFPELDPSIKWFSLWCAERVRHLMSLDEASALDVTKRYLDGTATLEELEHVSYARAGRAALWVVRAARNEGWESAKAANQVCSAARNFFYNKAEHDAMLQAQTEEFQRLIECHENGIEYSI